MTQKIGIFTPHYLFAVTVDYNWDLRHFPSEFGPKKMRKMLINVFEEKKDLKALPKRRSSCKLPDSSRKRVGSRKRKSS